MMILSTAWNNFKARPDIWFFYGFLATFTLSVRKVLFYYPIAGQFNEWTGIYLYLSDIFLILTLLFWFKLILEHNYDSLSILFIKNWLKKAYVNSPTHQTSKHSSNMPKFNECNNNELFYNKHIFWCAGLPLFLVLWSFASIFWSENQAVALFRSLKLLEMALLYSYIFYSFSFFSCPQTSGEQKNYTSNSNKMFRVEQDHGKPVNLYDKCFNKAIFTFGSIFIIGLIQAVIAIFQFIIQHSLGLIWLKESIISPDISGVAKIEFGGQKLIRAYGLMPHPNILGGFLVLSIILSLIIKHYFKINKTTKNQDGHKSFMWNILSSNIFMNLSVLVQLIALILTFSKSAILGLVFSLSYLLFRSRGKQILLFHVKQLFLILFVCLLLALISVYIFNLDFHLFLNQGISLRKAQIDVSRETMPDKLILGYGMGQYVNQLNIVTRGTLEYWQYQPLHNVFLLILSELGFVGLFVFIIFLWKLLRPIVIVPCLPRSKELFHPSRNVPRGTFYGAGMEQFFCYWGGTIFKVILMAFIFIMLFDHYFWDIQQGQIMLWLVLGIMAGLGLSRKIEFS